MLSQKPSEVKRRAWMKSPAGRAYIYKRTRRPGPRFGRLRYKCRKLDIPFSLTRLQFEDLIARPCSYCGFPTGETGVGLDQQVPGAGYTSANAIPCCAVCNMAKSNVFTFEEMKMLGMAIRKLRLRRKF